MSSTKHSLQTLHREINPHAAQPISLLAMAKSFWRNRQLIVQMTKREVIGRYKGSAMGLAWSFFNPVFMLVVYTFVFSEIFKSRWGGIGGDDSKTQFAVVLFVGMIVLSLFSEVLNRAPTLIVANVNYVKKVIFPLDILPVIAMGAALFHSFISLCVLLAAFALFNGYLHWTAIFIPLVLLPLVILTLGLSWMLASLGVFLRDVGQSIGIITTSIDVPFPGLLSGFRSSGKIPSVHHGKPAHLHHRASARSPDLGAFAQLGGIGHLHPCRHCRRLGRFCLVSKNQKRLCRCPLINGCLQVNPKLLEFKTSFDKSAIRVAGCFCQYTGWHTTGRS